MTIETKYNIGDDVWFMINNTAQRARILEIQCVYRDRAGIRFSFFGLGKCDPEEELIISYWLDHTRAKDTYVNLTESSLFPTKDELLKSL